MSAQTINHYCVFCKAEREVKNVEAFITKNGRKAVGGVCATCGHRVVKVGGK